MTKLEKLTKFAPCNIIYREDVYLGGYFWDRQVTSVDSTIEIDTKLPPHIKLAVLAHETGHAHCHKKGCECYQKNLRENTESNSLCEYHANLFTLKWLLGNREKKALQWVIKLIEKQSHYTNKTHYNGNHHGDAARKIMKLELWQKCKVFVEQE